MGASAPYEIVSLTSSHDRDSFDCGNAWLNHYLRLHALRNQDLGYGRTYVMVRQNSAVIEGFFTLSMGGVVFANLPDELVEKVPKYPMPVAHMGCLAVRKEVQGQGLGGLMLIDAFRRVLSAAELVAARALEVKAIDETAKRWYLQRGFKAFLDHPMHLYLPMVTLREVVAKA